MVQIIQKNPTFAGALGTGLGSGLGQGLQQLSQLHLQDVLAKKQRSQIAKGLEPLLKSKKAADVLSNLPPDVLKLAIQNPAVLFELLKEEQQGAAPELLGQPGGEGGGLFEGLGQVGGPQQGPTQEQLQYLERLANPLGTRQPQQPIFGQQPTEEIQQALTPQAQQARQPIQQPVVQENAQQRAANIADLFTSPQEKREREKLELKRRQVESAEKGQAFKATAEERNKIIQEARTARETIRDLNRLEELEHEGKLNTPGYVEGLKRMGLDIPALLHPGSEEFQKIAQNFLRDAKAYYGGRVSNYEVEQFLKTVPSLSQSPEGRKRVIANLKNIANAKLAYNETLKEVLKENRGIPPLDLAEQIDDRIESKLEKLSEKFKQDLAKPVPKGQNKFITALQAGLGSVIGAPGKLINAVGGAAGRVTHLPE